MSKVEPFRKVPKHKWLSKIIRIDTPAGASEACNKLSNEWNEFAITRGKPLGIYVGIQIRNKKRLLIRAVSEAIRRCKAQLARKHLSTSERIEFKEIIKIYQKWLKNHRLSK